MPKIKKIAYLSNIAYSDVDLSFLHEMQKIADVTYILLLGSFSQCSCAIDIRGCKLKEGLHNASEYEPLKKFAHIIDMDRFYVFYSPAKHAYEGKSFLFNYKLYKILNKFDVVHTTIVPSSLNIFMPLLRNKLVLTLHDPIPHSSATYKADSINRKIAFKYIRNIILLNKNQKEEFINYYGISNKTQIYNSALSCYTYLQTYNDSLYSVKKPYILYFGNIVSYKGLDYLFPAMKKVHELFPNLRLIIAGNGRFYFDIEEYKKLDYFQIENRFIPDNELADMIRNCEFTVVPYIDATQSGVIMSAYAFNKPCVATNVGGLPEMVIDGKNGIIVNPKDVEVLADAICKLHCSQEKIKEFASTIEEEYSEGLKSWKYIATQIKKLYENI